MQALQETLNTDFPGDADVAQEEGPKPMLVNDPTPKNKSNFYYAAETTPSGGQKQSANR